MTSEPQTRTEHVGRGALLALAIIPVGVVVFVAISSIGFIASIVSFGVAFGAYWLYQRGAGGVITRTGAWVILAIVVVTILLSLYASLVWEQAVFLQADKSVNVNDLSVWQILGLPSFWDVINSHFGELISDRLLDVILALAFGVLGSFRILRNAFRNTSARPTQAYPQTAAPVQPTYRNDVDAPPTGSADDKTAPPANGV